MNIDKAPSGESRKPRSFEELKASLAGHTGGFRIVKESPGPGQLTPAELSLFDPASGEQDFASAALILGVAYDGEYSTEKFLAELTHDDDGEDIPAAERAIEASRAKDTFTRMLEAGLLQERDGKIHLNTALR